MAKPRRGEPTMTKRAPHQTPGTIDEVERLRQVRRSLEQKFVNTDDFFDGIERSEKTHSRKLTPSVRRRILNP
jgi:hypothetical protein